MPRERAADALPAPRITLDQWRCLVAVVDAGGYAQAASRLHKSQSSVTYAIQKLESQLRVSAFEIQGRKAVLTSTGQMLYRRGRALVDEAASAERAARTLSAGWEAEIRLAIEVLFPTWVMYDCLAKFAIESPQTRIEWFETVIDGTQELLQAGRADLAISPRIPPGHEGEPLLQSRFIPVAHPSHALHRLGREITVRDLRRHRHLVVRDTSQRRDSRVGTIEVEQRWTVSNMTTSIGAACRGHGWAWLPEDKIRGELAANALAQLPLRGGRERVVPLYLIIADPDAAGPGTKRLAALIHEQVAISLGAADG